MRGRSIASANFKSPRRKPTGAVFGKEVLVLPRTRTATSISRRVTAVWRIASWDSQTGERQTRRRCQTASCVFTSNDPHHDRVHQTPSAGHNAYDRDNKARELMKWPHIHGTPVFARFDAKHAYMFVWPEKDTLKRFEWDRALFKPIPTTGAEYG